MAAPKSIAFERVTAVAGAAGAIVATFANSRTKKHEKASMRLTACQAGFVAGSVAEFTKVSCIYPLDLLRNRMSCSTPGVYSGMRECILKTFHGEGVCGFYKGIGATYCSNIGKGTIGFGMYNSLLARFSPKGQQRDPFSAVVQASVASSFFSSAFEGPLEIIAVQLQTQHVHATRGKMDAQSNFASCAVRTAVAERRAVHNTVVRYGYSGGMDVVQAIVRNRAWTLGGTPLVMRNILWFTATFGTFEQMKATAARVSLGSDSKDSQANLGMGWRVVCGATTGVVSWTVSFPLEVLKVNMMGQPLAPRFRTYDSSLECARQLYSEGGMLRFYRGLAPTILRAMPAYMIVLNVYDKVRDSLVRA